MTYFHCSLILKWFAPNWPYLKHYYSIAPHITAGTVLPLQQGLQQERKVPLTSPWQVQRAIIEATTVFSSLRVLSTWQELCLQMLCNSTLQLYCETFQNQQSGMRKEGSNVCTGTGYSEVTAQHWNSSSYLAVVGSIQQNISCCKISVNKPFLGEVDHACNYLAAEFQKLHRTHCLKCPGERGCR